MEFKQAEKIIAADSTALIVSVDYNQHNLWQFLKWIGHWEVYLKIFWIFFYSISVDCKTTNRCVTQNRKNKFFTNTNNYRNEKKSILLEILWLIRSTWRLSFCFDYHLNSPEMNPPELTGNSTDFEQLLGQNCESVSFAYIKSWRNTGIRAERKN